MPARRFPVRRLTSAEVRSFRADVYRHYRTYGRHQLPWRLTDDPYAIYVSEVMLQQTQASRVQVKFAEFLAAFPTWRALAAAPQAQVLRVWSGLGYNRRALNLHRAAQRVVQEWRGRLPADLKAIVSLPGIGYATAAAIVAYAFGAPVAFIETNVRSIFIHRFFPKRRRVSDRELEPLVAQALDRRRPRHWHYALMDYGVELKRRHANPSRRSKHYVRHEPFVGSNRRARGLVLAAFVAGRSASAVRLAELLGLGRDQVEGNLLALGKEGFLVRRGRGWRLA